VIAEAYQYDAYGKPTVWSGAGVDTVWFTNDDVVSVTTNGAPVSAAGNRRLYTGHYFESLDLVESGLYYFGERWQSPDLGRFVSRDPVGYDDGLNIYQYVRSGISRYVDPYGLGHYPYDFYGPIEGGNYIHEVWTLDDRTGGTTVAQLNDGTGGQRKFYHQNTLYSTFALTDETGIIAEAYQYDAYGKPTVWSGAGVDTVWFTNDDVLSVTTNGGQFLLWGIQGFILGIILSRWNLGN